jgi:hypothetical protein
VFGAYRSQPHLVWLYLWQYLERHDVGVSVRRPTRPVAEKDATE